MENLLRVKDISMMMGCSYDTARARMKEMPGVMNVGTEKRRQLMVPLAGLRDWMANHRMEVKQLPAFIPGPDGRMARMDRRTGKLVIRNEKKGR